jgi:hypothetical protein
MRKSMRVLAMVALPLSLLGGCQSERHAQSASGGAPPSGRFSSADQERAMVSDMNGHQPADTSGLTAKQDRSRTTEVAGARTNEMSGGEALSRAGDQAMSEQSRKRQPSVIEERTIVIVPMESREEVAAGPRDRSSEEVRLHRGAQEGIPGSDLSVADIAPYEADFRQNYEANYANSGYGYDQYRPAYQYGFGLAKDPRYTTMNWKALEMQARRNWNEATMGPWDRYKDAVRYGWERGQEATPGQG